MKRPLEDLNKIWVGTVTIGVIAAVVSVIVGVGKMSFGETTYRGEFAQAAQISSGDQVTVAGINVGTVGDVRLAGDRVSVTFKVRKNIHLGGQTRAAIKLTTLLGRRYLELSPVDEGDLDRHTIPLANTAVPYDLQQTLADATTTFGDVDADLVAKSLTTMSDGLHGVPEALPQALANVKALADIVAARRDQLGSLLKNIDAVTSLVRDQRADLGAMVIQGRDVLSELAGRSAAVHRLFDSATAMINTVSTIVDDRPAIDSMIDGMQKLTKMIADNDASLRNLFQVMPVAFRNIANAGGSGPALDVNLPAGILVDSWMCAISQRAKQFDLAQYFTNCSPAPDPFPGWPPPDPSRLPG
ncbi:MlaD family protein [Mycolicibacterium sp. 050232]|uniref:MlaD family protein n=1 Tax=Mycolicibacterium sp. 050232 TaxID=3113982 RepID=UPI002E2B295F|nr:MlaD family protein [Mycolicibacterium sp. 050232]MED5810830.1 MlaD family protein [Mycolicibacterium sp. 050232]